MPSLTSLSFLLNCCKQALTEKMAYVDPTNAISALNAMRRSLVSDFSS